MDIRSNPWPSRKGKFWEFSFVEKDWDEGIGIKASVWLSFLTWVLAMRILSLKYSTGHWLPQPLVTPDILPSVALWPFFWVFPSGLSCKGVLEGWLPAAGLVENSPGLLLQRGVPVFQSWFIQTSRCWTGAKEDTDYSSKMLHCLWCQSILPWTNVCAAQKAMLPGPLLASAVEPSTFLSATL